MISDDVIDVQFSFDGWRPSTSDASCGAPFPDALLIPRDDWRGAIEDLKSADTFAGPHPRGCLVANYGPYVFNQYPESSCVYNATAGAIMRRWNMQLGFSYQVILSPMSGYCRVAKHRHSGSYVYDALEQSSELGLLPSSSHGYEHPHTCHENTPFIRPDKLPPEWQDTARHFRCIEWLRIDSREQFASALLNQYPVVYGRSGHAVVGEDLTYERGRYYCRACDSYGYDQRDGTGRIYDSERNWATGGAWACRVTTMPDAPEITHDG